MQRIRCLFSELNGRGSVESGLLVNIDRILANFDEAASQESRQTGDSEHRWRRFIVPAKDALAAQKSRNSSVECNGSRTFLHHLQFPFTCCATLPPENRMARPWLRSSPVYPLGWRWIKHLSTANSGGGNRGLDAADE